MAAGMQTWASAKYDAGIGPYGSGVTPDHEFALPQERRELLDLVEMWIGQTHRNLIIYQNLSPNGAALLRFAEGEFVRGRQELRRCVDAQELRALARSEKLAFECGASTYDGFVRAIGQLSAVFHREKAARERITLARRCVGAVMWEHRQRCQPSRSHSYLQCDSRGQAS